MVYAEDDVDSPYVQHRMNRSDCIARQGNTRMFNNTARSVRYSKYIERIISYVRIYVYIFHEVFPLLIRPPRS